jgi:hypothetical protein
VEKAVDVTATMRQYGVFLTLAKAAAEKPFRFVCRYLPLS